MTEWIKVRGSQSSRPLEIDTTSSQYYVYERKNIHQETYTTEDGHECTEWIYDERKYTQQEYENLNSATTQLLMQNINDMAVEIALLKEGNN